jgi:hypothetical protein
MDALSQRSFCSQQHIDLEHKKYYVTLQGECVVVKKRCIEIKHALSLYKEALFTTAH